MPELLTTGCMLTCSFGLTPSPFVALELPGKPTVDAMPAATILEIVPEANISTFGMCESMANPEVVAATAAAMGALTPMPCVPVIAVPWEPPSVVLSYDGIPLANVESMCMCIWGGEITVEVPAEMTVMDES